MAFGDEFLQGNGVPRLCVAPLSVMPTAVSGKAPCVMIGKCCADVALIR